MMTGVETAIKQKQQIIASSFHAGQKVVYNMRAPDPSRTNDPKRSCKRQILLI